jgi:hypothetical protein
VGLTKVADKLDMSQNAAARRLIDVGLRSYVDGQRPEIEAVEVRTEPKLENCLKDKNQEV